MSPSAVLGAGLFASFSDGLHRRLLPELGDIFLQLVENGDWDRVEAAREAAHSRLRRFVDPLFRLFDKALAPEEAIRLADALEEKIMGRETA